MAKNRSTKSKKESKYLEQKDIQKLDQILKETVGADLYRLVLSKPLMEKEISKVSIRPIMIQNKLKYQETIYKGTQVFHENYEQQAIVEKLTKYLQGRFGQLDAECSDRKVLVLTNKKGTLTIKVKKNNSVINGNTALNTVNVNTTNGIAANKKALNENSASRNTANKNGENKNVENKNVENKNVENKNVENKNGVKKEIQNLQHNRTKNYILNEGEPVDFLIALGVMMPDGRVAKARYDKFKQINRYLEFVRDVLPELENAVNQNTEEKSLRIIDFGCGKSYLTFALYYYLKVKQNLNVEIVGLDLKKDVIADCNHLKDRLGYDGLKFLCGDIKDYENPENKVDMVVSLHACDIATDYAIDKAVRWNARVIFAVPCCQHELNREMTFGKKEPKELAALMKYGIIRERMAALITDAYRANCMEEQGYDTQILEFIDMEHTPKNILIRGVKRNKMSKRREVTTDQIDEIFGMEPTLKKLLKAKNNTV